MELEYLRLLYAYNLWANHHILDSAEQLTPEELRTWDSGSYGSIHTTLVHMMDVEWSWLDERWRDSGPSAELSPDDFADVVAIRTHWADVEAQLMDFVDNLTPDGEGSPNRILVWIGDGGVTKRRPLWQLMLHLANHGTQHRSEIAAMLTRAGHSPGDMDITRYLNVRDGLE
ncbi:MAG TPA: DinB family protein [Nitrolancea sp.]|jgi:uncharacterized damage-inducible protein DinB|nr:DinB family protein [Nitrolancea sp.]